MKKYKCFIIVHPSFNIYIEGTEVLVDNIIQYYKPLILLKALHHENGGNDSKIYFQEKETRKSLITKLKQKIIEVVKKKGNRSQE